MRGDERTRERRKKNLLGKLRDLGTIVVRDKIGTEDLFSGIGSVFEVDFQKASLKSGIFRTVVLKNVEKKGGDVLNVTTGHEGIDGTVDIHQRAPFSGQEHLGKVLGSRGVASDDSLQELHPVGRVALTFGVGDHRIVVTVFCENGDYFVMGFRFFVDHQG